MAALNIPSTSSPEYKAFQQCFEIITLHVQGQLNSMRISLFQRGYIDDSLLEDNNGTSEDKALKLLTPLLRRIQWDTSAFHGFVEILKSGGPSGNEITRVLHERYQSECKRKCEPNAQQPPAELLASSSFFNYNVEKRGCVEYDQDFMAFCKRCIELRFSVSALVADHIFPISDDQRTALGNIGIKVCTENEEMLKTDGKKVSSQNISVPTKQGGQSPTWSTHNGKYDYGASGTTEVLLITSNLTTQDENVVQRRPVGELTDDDRQKLEHQGVPRDCHHDDLSIMKARFSLDKAEKSIAEVLRDDGSLTCEQVTKKITQLMNETDTSGVVLHYIGPGKKGTGDWCFSDGFISFRDIMHLYLQNAYFKGRVLTIVSNCSYSGFWVKEAMKFLDEHGVGPCGHTAKEKGILVKVYASCLANEIPAELAFSTRCAQNDKNTGTVQYNITLRGEEIHHGQHTSGLDFTEVQCKSKIDEPCTRAPGSTWQQWSTAQRVKKVRGKDKGRSAWHYVLLVDDEERIREYHDKIKEGSLDIADYGQILKSGWGQDPPKETKKWIEEQYFVNYDYQPPSIKFIEIEGID